MGLISGKQNFGDFSFGEAIGTGLSKSVTERILMMTPVGNNTFLSGFLKLGLSYGAGKMIGKNKFGKILANGLAVDGSEDIINNVMGMIGFGKSFGTMESQDSGLI